MLNRGRNLRTLTTPPFIIHHSSFASWRRRRAAGGLGGGGGDGRLAVGLGGRRGQARRLAEFVHALLDALLEEGLEVGGDLRVADEQRDAVLQGNRPNDGVGVDD